MDGKHDAGRCFFLGEAMDHSLLSLESFSSVLSLSSLLYALRAGDVSRCLSFSVSHESPCLSISLIHISIHPCTGQWTRPTYGDILGGGCYLLYHHHSARQYEDCLPTTTLECTYMYTYLYVCMYLSIYVCTCIEICKDVRTLAYTQTFNTCIT